jgi:hypothetical protein
MAITVGRDPADRFTEIARAIGTPVVPPASEVSPAQLETTIHPDNHDASVDSLATHVAMHTSLAYATARPLAEDATQQAEKAAAAVNPKTTMARTRVLISWHRSRRT